MLDSGGGGGRVQVVEDKADMPGRRRRRQARWAVNKEAGVHRRWRRRQTCRVANEEADTPGWDIAILSGEGSDTQTKKVKIK